MKEQIDRNFVYYPPKAGQPEKYTDLRNKAKELANMIDEYAVNCREKALALTKLEECVMWANAAIARN